MKPTIRTRHNREKFIIIFTYTDDIMGGSSDKKEAEKAKQELEECYDVKIMEKVDYMLEIKVKKIEKEI